MSWLQMETILLDLSRNTAEFLLNWLLQSTFLICIGLACARILSRRGSAAQSVIYCTTLASVLICPPLTGMISQSGMSNWSLAVTPFRTEQTPAASDVQSPSASEQSPAISLSKTAPRSSRPWIAPAASQRPVAERQTVSNHEEPIAVAEEPIADKTAESVALVEAVGAAAVPQSRGVAFPQRHWLAVAAAGLWGLISAWLLVRLMVAWWRLAGIRQSALPAEGITLNTCHDLSAQLGVEPPLVLYTPFLPSPCLAGVWAPAVLLPDGELPVSLRNVLIHELAHLKRRDGHWNLLRKIATGLFWFQPLLWVLSRKMEMAAEEVCDDFVVELGGDRAEYAHRLVDVAEFSSVPMATAGVAFVSLRSMLSQRVMRIMDTSRRLSTRTSRRLLSGALAVGCIVTFAIGFLGAAPQTAEPSKSVDDATVANQAADVTTDATVISVAEPSSEQSPVTRIADAGNPPSQGLAPPAAGKRGPLPGLISSPNPLPGNRRWQMYTKSSGSSATSVSWSPDGKWLAVASGQIVRLFDFPGVTPELKIVLAGHGDLVKSVRFNAQGDRLATASFDGTVRIWDLDGREQFVYRGHEDAVQDVSWHPDGQRLASASLDGTVRIWSTDGTTKAMLPDHDAPVNTVAWNPNGKLLVSGCENKTIRYWNEDGAAGPVVEAHIGPVKSLAWNFNGSQLASCDFGIEASDGQDTDRAHIKVWDAEGKPVSSVLIDQPLSHIAWNPDGKQIVVGHWRSITLWTVGAARGNTRFFSALNGIVPVSWRQSGDLISAGPMIVDANGQDLTMIPLRQVSLHSVGLNADGSLLGVGRAARTFDIFNTQGELRYQSPPMASGIFNLVYSMSWSPDGKTVIPGMRNVNSLQRYDAEGNKVGAAVTLPGDMRSVVWSKDGRYVAAGGDRQLVSLVDLETSKAIEIGKQGHGITQVRFTPDQQQVCSAGFDGCVRFWTLDGKAVKVFESILAPIDSLGWSSDGQLLATGHQDNLIRLWSPAGEIQAVMGGHGGHVEAVEFNPQGTLLASGGRDNSVRLWSRDGAPVAVLQGHAGTVYGLQWTPDGKGIYSAAEDGTIRFWNVETGVTEWLALLGESKGYVTLDAHGRIKSGDEGLLSSEFVFFAEDDQGRLVKTNWTDLR